MAVETDRRTMLLGSAAAIGLATSSGVVGSGTLNTAPPQPTDLRVDAAVLPLGLENPQPQFSWRFVSSTPGMRQSAYRVRVASCLTHMRAHHGDLWDSGRVESSDCFGIDYLGTPLHARQRCWWSVEAWDQSGRPCASSEPAWFEMGLMSPENWTAQWIAAEDRLELFDRAAELMVLTTEEPAKGRDWQLRRALDISEPTSGGALFISHEGADIAGVWIDGVPLDTQGLQLGGPHEPLRLPALPCGHHLLAIAARVPHARVPPTVELPPGQSIVPPSAPTVSCHIRLDRRDAACVGLTQGVWKAQYDEGSSWTTVDFDDSLWPNAKTSAAPNQSVVVTSPLDCRREFVLEKEIAAARLYVSALGAYEVRLNGKRIGDALLTPELSQYEAHILYQVYDIGAQLRRGANAIGVIIGDGWYASHPDQFGWGPPPRRFIVQIEVEFADGTTQTIGSDPDWRVARSAIRFSHLIHGETQDRREHRPGWDRPGFNVVDWELAHLAPPPAGRLRAQASPPIRAVHSFPPQTTRTLAPGVHVIDFGQNFSGWVRMRVRGPAGSRIEIRYAEELEESGDISGFVYFYQRQADIYFLRGDGEETLEPHFAYQGFRYVRVTAPVEVPIEHAVEGVAIHSDVEFTGAFWSEHPLLNKIWRNALWGQRSNMMGIPTACNNRAERDGWMMDAGIAWGAAAYNMDVRALTRRQLDNVRDAQLPNGAIPIVAPLPLQGRTKAEMISAKPPPRAPGWGEGAFRLAWTSWRHYGDTSVVRENWQALLRHLSFIDSANPDGVWRHERGWDLGDWLSIGPSPLYNPDLPPTTPFDLFATAMWFHALGMAIEMGEAAGYDGDTRYLRLVSGRIRDAFHREFVQADGRVGNESQASYALALSLDLVPQSLRRLAGDRLAASVRAQGLKTGAVGTPFLLDVLVELGHADLFYDLLLARSHPSWGYMIEHGATTMWEAWDGALARNRFEASHNHLPLTSVAEVLYRHVAGIDAVAPGFATVSVRVVTDPRVRRAGGAYLSPLGRIATRWDMSLPARFALEVEIPPNALARVHMPIFPKARLLEGGRDLGIRNDVAIAYRAEDEAVLAIGAGRFHFEVRS